MRGNEMEMGGQRQGKDRAKASLSIKVTGQGQWTDLKNWYHTELKWKMEMKNGNETGLSTHSPALFCSTLL
jgi:hypothetical protein